MRRWAGAYSPTALDEAFDTGMLIATNCWDRGRGETTRAALAFIRHDPTSALDVMTQSSLVCEAWGGRHAPPGFNRPVGSTVRTLFMSAEFDSSTPPAWARAARRGFPRSQQVSFGGLSHAALYSLCGQQVAASFLAAPDRRPDTSCVAPLGRIAFATAP